MTNVYVCPQRGLSGCDTASACLSAFQQDMSDSDEEEEKSDSSDSDEDDETSGSTDSDDEDEVRNQISLQTFTALRV